MNGQVEFKDTPLDDGGPAFPAPELGRKQFSNPAVYWGLSMRDYFAAHASEFDVQNALEDLGSSGGLIGASTGSERNARARYAHADAMLKVRAAA